MLYISCTRHARQNSKYRNRGDSFLEVVSSKLPQQHVSYPLPPEVSSLDETRCSGILKVRSKTTSILNSGKYSCNAVLLYIFVQITVQNTVRISEVHRL